MERDLSFDTEIKEESLWNDKNIFVHPGKQLLFKINNNIYIYPT